MVSGRGSCERPEVTPVGGRGGRGRIPGLPGIDRRPGPPALLRSRVGVESGGGGVASGLCCACHKKGSSRRHITIDSLLEGLRGHR